jgi:hypothetical protein
MDRDQILPELAFLEARIADAMGLIARYSEKMTALQDRGRPAEFDVSQRLSLLAKRPNNSSVEGLATFAKRRFRLHGDVLGKKGPYFCLGDHPPVRCSDAVECLGLP